MQIVSDRGMDLAPEQMEGLDIRLAPLTLTLDGKTYRSGVDIQPDEFYRLLAASPNYPSTSQPSAGDFAEIYRDLAATDPEILSIHISSGLSGTLQSARAGAEMVPQAHVTFVDSKTLSCPLGWQVEAAARALKAGWPLERILALVERISATTEGMYTIATLRYLAHGGRISHLKGLIGSLLNIKPIIGVEKVHGTYVTHGQEITLKRAIHRLGDVILGMYPEGSRMRFQCLHGNNLEGAEILRERLSKLYDATFSPTTIIAPVLGAHTGAGLVGLAFAPAETFADMP
jgi:DegV family protein with EDD domain